MKLVAHLGQSALIQHYSNRALLAVVVVLLLPLNSPFHNSLDLLQDNMSGLNVMLKANAVHYDTQQQDLFASQKHRQSL